MSFPELGTKRDGDKEGKGSFAARVAAGPKLFVIGDEDALG